MNAHSKIEDTDPLECFPLCRRPVDPETINNLSDLSMAMSGVYLDVRALAWMQNLIADAFVEPRQNVDPFGLDRISLFQTASNILTKELVERVNFLGNVPVSRLEGGDATKRDRP